MNIKRLSIILLVLSLFLGKTSAQQQFVYDLWPNGAEFDNGLPEDTARLYVFLPMHPNGRSVVICPGGGYENLAMGHEGFDWAPFFNNLGITAAVLKYRMPNGHRDVPMSDVEQAIRLMKEQAYEWHLNPEDVGVMGFSAGGHVASSVATRGHEGAIPSFQILIYPLITMDINYTHVSSHDNLMGKKPGAWQEGNYSSEQRVKPTTPRAYILLCDDDDAVKPSNGINYYKALYNNNVPATLYVYPKGLHGFGIRTSFPYHLEMLNSLTAWLSTF